jgi:hypothetical protein
MNRMLALVLAGSLWLGTASAANAQFSLSIGNPYAGGYGAHGVPYSGYGVTSGLLPGTTTYYSSGYYGAVPSVAAYSSVVPYAAPYSYGGLYGASPYAFRSGYVGAAPFYRSYYGGYGIGGYGFRRGFYGGRW